MSFNNRTLKAALQKGLATCAKKGKLFLDAENCGEEVVLAVNNTGSATLLEEWPDDFECENLGEIVVRVCF
jgi:hypothetical protein